MREPASFACSSTCHVHVHVHVLDRVSGLVFDHASGETGSVRDRITKKRAFEHVHVTRARARRIGDG